MLNLMRWVSPRTIKETFVAADRLPLPVHGRGVARGGSSGPGAGLTARPNRRPGNLAGGGDAALRPVPARRRGAAGVRAAAPARRRAAVDASIRRRREPLASRFRARSGRVPQLRTGDRGAWSADHRARRRRPAKGAGAGARDRRDEGDPLPERRRRQRVRRHRRGHLRDRYPVLDRAPGRAARSVLAGDAGGRRAGADRGDRRERLRGRLRPLHRRRPDSPRSPRPTCWPFDGSPHGIPGG